MTSKGGAAGSASERVVSLARSGTKRMTCPSELSGWSISFKFCFELEGKGGTCLLCKNLRLRAFRRVEIVLSKSLLFSVTDVPAHVTFLWRHGASLPASSIVSKTKLPKVLPCCCGGMLPGRSTKEKGGEEGAVDEDGEEKVACIKEKVSVHKGDKEVVQRPLGQSVMRSWDCSQIENEVEDESW